MEKKNIMKGKNKSESERVKGQERKRRNSVE